MGNFIITPIENNDPCFTESVDNLPKKERKPLSELKAANDIIIKKADKGICLPRHFYCDKLVLEDHLNMKTYSKAPKDADKRVYKNLINLIEKHKNYIKNKEIEYYDCCFTQKSTKIKLLSRNLEKLIRNISIVSHLKSFIKTKTLLVNYHDESSTIVI